MAMITYGIKILPIIRGIQETHQEFSQPQYADDEIPRGYFRDIKTYLEGIRRRVPDCGYLPETTKSILVIPGGTSHRPEGYGPQGSDGDPLSDCINLGRILPFFMVRGEVSWVVQSGKDVRGVGDMLPAGRLLWNVKFPQTGVGSFVEHQPQSGRTVPDGGGNPMQGLLTIIIPRGRGKVTIITLKQVVLALSEPTITNMENWAASCVVPSHMVGFLLGCKKFRSIYHDIMFKDYRTDIWHRNYIDSIWVLDEVMGKLPPSELCRLHQGRTTGIWIYVHTSTVNGKQLGTQEYIGTLFLCYGIEPPGLPIRCYGCGETCSICHTLYYKKGCLIMTHHNTLHDRFVELSSKSFTTLHVRNNPLIHNSLEISSVRIRRLVSRDRVTPYPTTFQNPCSTLERRGVFLSRISDRRVPTVYTTCESLTMTHPLISRFPWRRYFKRKKTKGGRSTWSTYPSNAVNY